MTARPIGVTFVAAFLLLGTLLAEATAVSLFIPGTFLDMMWKLNEEAYLEFNLLGGQVIGLFLCTLGILTAAASFGLLHGKRWSWYIAVSIFALQGIGDVLALALRKDFVKGGSGVVIAGIFLFFLLRPRTRLLFLHSGGDRA